MKKKNLIKFVTVLCLAALLFTASAPAHAASTKYTSTRNFLSYLDSKGVKYKYVGVDGKDEEVTVSYSLENFSSMTCKLFFRDDDEVNLRVYDIVYANNRTDYVLSTINSLNYEYKYAKFVLDTSDNSIRAEMDMFIDASTCGAPVFEAMIMLLSVIDDDNVAATLYSLI